MKTCLAVCVLISATILPALAANSRLEKSLRHLDPATRQIQICDLAAMRRIDRDANSFRPDRAIVDAISGPRIHENVLKGSGGAFRSRGQWYRFSFTCSTSADRMKVIAFEYKLGKAIPEEKWQQYGLWR